MYENLASVEVQKQHHYPESHILVRSSSIDQ